MEHRHERHFPDFGGKWIWVNSSVFSSRPEGYAEIRHDGTNPYAYIRGGYIMQKLEDFRLVPEYRQTNSEGLRVPGVVYLSFMYRVEKAGTLRIEFVNSDKSGFENFNMFYHEEELEATNGWKLFNLDGLWNGTGDFKLSFTGIIYISLLVFSTNKADALTYKYRTLFEQSERLVKISAAVFDRDENMLQETGLVVKPEGAGLYAQDANGKVALIGVSVEEEDEYGNTRSKIKLTAEDIILEGAITANGNFKILEDGSIETHKATILNSELTNVRINGAIRTPFRDGYYSLSDDGGISLSTIGLQNNNNVVIPETNTSWITAIVIPFTPEYNGFRAVLMNDDWGSGKAVGVLQHTAPDGKYYFEDGVQKTTLSIPPHSGVEMIGFGEGNDFKGWMIVNRIYRKDNHNGYSLRLMFHGIVRDNKMVKLKKYNDEDISFSRISEGRYRITFGVPFSDANNYAVFLTGYAAGVGRYASVMEQTTNYFDVYTGDDSSPNDGGFQFLIINTSGMYI